MKLPAARVAAVCLATAALLCTIASGKKDDDISPAEHKCLEGCQAEVMAPQMKDCAPWRERLPRPDLFSLCQDGFDLGVSAGCKGYCNAIVDEGSIASMRLDACMFLRATPPMDRRDACHDGFSMAVNHAKESEAVDKYRKNPHRMLQASEPAPAAEKAAVPPESIPAFVAVENDKVDVKKPFTIKKAPEVRNILEQAREEAQAAFLDQRATDV